MKTTKEERQELLKTHYNAEFRTEIGKRIHLSDLISDIDEIEKYIKKLQEENFNLECKNQELEEK